MLGNVDPQHVTVAPLSPAVYRGRDNTSAARFQRYDEARGKYVPLDFSNVLRMILVLPETQPQVVFDTLTAPDTMDWLSLGQGEIEFKLAHYALTPGTYKARLIVYDEDHPNGQVVVSGLQTKNEFNLIINEVLGDGVLPPPMPSGGEATVREYGEDISALRVVYERGGRVFLLDPTDPLLSTVDLLLGITITAGDAGTPGVIQRSGTIDDTSWSWAEGLVFLGAAGTLTQVPPTTGWEVVVGAAPSAQRLNIDFDEPVRLA